MLRPRSASSLHTGRAALLVFVAAAAVAISHAGAQLARAMPDALSDREFWDFFATMSEEGGTFPSENFVSNEQTYQHVIPALQRTVAPGGVYLGVGPEQNFTYIANVRPRMAVIFDIRRQNAMAHLMYKAMFEIAPNRAAFLSLLFSRRLSKAVAATSTPAELFAALGGAADSVFDTNLRAVLERLQVKHGFALTDTDRQSITHVYRSFFEAGPSINYGYRMERPSFGTSYVSFSQLQSLTNATGVNMAFLANEENYQAVRALQLRNLIVPVVGDFAGPKAIRAVGAYLTQRHALVSAFYLSNVEQYLYRGAGDAQRFYENVKTLPIDSTSTFIRSVPASGDFFGPTYFSTATVGGATNYSVSVRDSAGVSVVTTTSIDSTGASTTTRRIDSSGVRQSPLQIFRSLRARDDSLIRSRLDSIFGRKPDSSASYLPFGGTRMIVAGGSSLSSGIARIRPTLEAFSSGNLSTYAALVASTKVDGWK